jgi:Uma2 family endonuclease
MGCGGEGGNLSEGEDAARGWYRARMTTEVPRWFERPLTHRDLDDLPENDGHRYEVIDGELYVASFEPVAHQRVATQLVAVLGSYLHEHPIGEVFTVNTKVVLDETTAVGPDLLYIARENWKGLHEDGFYGAPDLLVEVTSSKPEIDRVLKHRKYAASGVANYWIADPDTQTLEAFELSGGTYVLQASHKVHETFAPKLFPGLTIPLQEVWG